MPGKSVQQVEAGVKTSDNDRPVEDLLRMEVRAWRTRGLVSDYLESYRESSLHEKRSRAKSVPV